MRSWTAHFKEHGFGLCAAEIRHDRAFIGFIGLEVRSTIHALR